MTTTLSEAESKRLLAGYGLPVLDERTVATAAAAVVAANDMGYPCVLKLCGDAIAHKTERNLVRLSLGTSADVERSAQELLGQATSADGPVELLVAPMVRATREFIVGADRSGDFGPVVMIGVGGIFAEVFEDVVFRLLPADERELDAMLDDLDTQAMLGEFRGEPAVDRAQLLSVVQAVGNAMIDRNDIESIDINPVLIADGNAIAVDALVALV
ncbi:MAG: acetate--CoA ligase family protein [Acidimicrobiaceae bacterium]|nr:acetate--CoA ligase family protein [Acidimicrobiaceae bacterium]MCO4834905.1 acetate--CoA ligase family protein [Acidimicrobiaceae bacterium]MDB4102720.1 acetate--CoA ligase family protein [Acidimicrobiales bacterium]